MYGYQDINDVKSHTESDLGRDNSSFNSSSTGVVEKVHFLVAASQHRGNSVAEGSP